MLHSLYNLYFLFILASTTDGDTNQNLESNCDWWHRWLFIFNPVGIGCLFFYLLHTASNWEYLVLFLLLS